MRVVTRGAPLIAGALLLFAAMHAEAQRRGGFRVGGGFRGGGMSVGFARPSVTRPAGGFNRVAFTGNNLNRGVINTGNVYRGNVSGGTIYRGDVGRPINVDDVNINRDWGWNNGYNGCCYHPVAAGVAYGAAAAVTAAAIGSTVYTLPSDCVSTIVNGVTYMQCGSTWYEPQFYGNDASYTVVSPP
jgi:hypothetical protein